MYEKQPGWFGWCASAAGGLGERDPSLLSVKGAAEFNSGVGECGQLLCCMSDNMVSDRYLYPTARTTAEVIASYGVNEHATRLEDAVFLAASALPAGFCFGSQTWSATTAGSGQSVLSGVLAGFTFAGVVLVLSVRAPSGGFAAANAAKLLFSAFLGLAVAAYLLADQAADTYCRRASAEEVVAGGILGTFAIIMIVSLTWLTIAYGMQDHGVLRFLRHLDYVATAFVVLLLCTSSFSFLAADLAAAPSPSAVTSLYLAGGLCCTLGHPVSSRILAAALARVIPRRNPPGRNSGSRQPRFSAVDVCAWVALGYLTAAAISDAVVVSMTDNAWSRPSALIVYVLAWASLVLPLGVLILSWHSLPPQERLRDTRQEQDPLTVSRTPTPTRSVTGSRRQFASGTLAGATLTGIAAYGLIRTAGRWQRSRKTLRSSTGRQEKHGNG